MTWIDGLATTMLFRSLWSIQLIQMSLSFAIIVLLSKPIPTQFSGLCNTTFDVARKGLGDQRPFPKNSPKWCFVAHFRAH